MAILKPLCFPGQKAKCTPPSIPHGEWFIAGRALRWWWRMQEIGNFDIYFPSPRRDNFHKMVRLHFYQHYRSPTSRFRRRRRHAYHSCEYIIWFKSTGGAHAYSQYNLFHIDSFKDTLEDRATLYSIYILAHSTYSSRYHHARLKNAIYSAFLTLDQPPCGRDFWWWHIFSHNIMPPSICALPAISNLLPMPL